MRYTTRLTLVFGAIWALLLLLSLAGIYATLRTSLEGRIERQILHSARAFAELYNSARTGEIRPLGETYVALYNFDGEPVVINNPHFLVPAEVLVTATGEPQLYRGERFLAAYVKTSIGVLAIAKDLEFVYQLTEQVARAAILTFLLSLPLGWLLMRLGVGWANRPLVSAAEAIAQRKGADLSPIPYDGPEDDELGRIIARFNGLLDELRSARARERAFLAEVSHELRTPLTVLMGYLERLRKNPADGEALAGAERTARHLTRLVGDLLALARGEAERTVNPHIVDLADLVRNVVEGFPGVRFEARGEPEVLGDPDRLMQLVRNLVANAVRAAGRPEGVQVVVGETDGRAWIEVADDGPGIAPEVLPHLFERFSRGPEGGTGLGLAIAKQIAEAHEGTITVRSQPGHTVFRVELPGLEGEG